MSETKDDDTIGQTVTVKVNGHAADYDTLAAAGYTVEFTAVDSTKTDQTASFFKNISSSVAVSPVLADNVALEDYTVEVTVRKNGEIVVADKAVVKVRNLELTTTAIESESFTNSNTDVAVQKSTTLVTGETLTLNSIKTVNNGAKSTVTYTSGDILVQSSNPSVLSVDSSTGVISANTPGTAELTISYGDFEKKVKYTVTNTARVLTKAVPSKTSTTIIKGKDASVNVTAVDQYGDYLDELLTVVAPVNGIVTVEGDTGAGTSDDVQTDNVNASGDKTGAGTVIVAQDGTTFGSGTVLVKDSKGKTIGSFTVKTTAIDNVAKQTVELIKDLGTGYSNDTTLDISEDAIVGYELNKYTSENVFNGKVDLNADGYTVTYNSDVVIPSTALDSDGLPTTFNTGVADTGQISKEAIATADLFFEAVGTGTTDVVIYDSTGLKVHQFKLTVTNTDFAITGATLKQNALVDYAGKKFTVADFLTITASDNDDIVKGIQLSKPTTNVIRIAETAGADAAIGDLYIDVNGNGVQDSGEKVLGTAVISIVSGGKGTNFGSAADFTGVNLFATGTPAETVATDEGTLVFKIVDLNNNNKVLASTSVQVKVK